jgi:hypothetical protein
MVNADAATVAQTPDKEGVQIPLTLRLVGISGGVMAGLVPAIHAFLVFVVAKDVDARDQPGHDGDYAEA